MSSEGMVAASLPVSDLGALWTMLEMPPAIAIGDHDPRVDHSSRAEAGHFLESADARSRPLVDEFFSWADAKGAEVLPKGPLDEALGYGFNQRPRLELSFSGPRIPLHNNSSEARLRVIALGRHDYMFFRPSARRKKLRWPQVACRLLHC